MSEAPAFLQSVYNQAMTGFPDVTSGKFANVPFVLDGVKWRKLADDGSFMTVYADGVTYTPPPTAITPDGVRVTGFGAGEP